MKNPIHRTATVHNPRPAKKIEMRVDCGKYVVRTLTPDDASDRWAAWMSDRKNVRLLNSAPKPMTRADIVAYIKKFDQISHLLLGIFEKQSGLHIGFFRLDIDPKLNRCLMFFMIGERKYRHWSVTNELRVPFQNFLFDNLKLNTVLGSALTSNRAMVRYLVKSGWNVDKTTTWPVQSPAVAAAPSLTFLSLSREAWREWKRKNLTRNP